jgi:hypothetical protein
MLEPTSQLPLRAVGLRLLSELWANLDRSFPHLQAVLMADMSLPKPSPKPSGEGICLKNRSSGQSKKEQDLEWRIVRAACIREVCRKDAARGVELVLGIQASIQDAHPVVCVLGLESLEVLCTDDAIGEARSSRKATFVGVCLIHYIEYRSFEFSATTVCNAFWVSSSTAVLMPCVRLGVKHFSGHARGSSSKGCLLSPSAQVLNDSCHFSNSVRNLHPHLVRSLALPSPFSSSFKHEGVIHRSSFKPVRTPKHYCFIIVDMACTCSYLRLTTTSTLLGGWPQLADGHSLPNVLHNPCIMKLSPVELYFSSL